jgi:uncharacterized membrane protein YqhA
MFARLLASSRYMMILPVIGTLIGAFTLIIYELAVMAVAIIDAVKKAELTPKEAKIYAVGVVEGVDVFLIAIAVYIISIGLYALFVDETVERPRWLELTDLEDLKAHLVSVVIAVLAVLLLREAVAWDGSRDILGFGLAVGATIAALALFLKTKKESP